MRETQVRSLGWEDPWRRKWQPTPVFVPGVFHGQRSLAGYSPWGCKELDTTEETANPSILINGQLQKIKPSLPELVFPLKVN